MTSRTRLPTVLPTRPVSQPGMTWPSPIGVVNGVLRAHEESKTFPVRQITPVYWTAMSSPFFTTAPVPLIRVVTESFFGAVTLAGILIVGPAVLPAAGVGDLLAWHACGAERRVNVDDEHQRVGGSDALRRVAARAEVVRGRDHREHPAAQILPDQRRLKAR